MSPMYKVCKAKFPFKYGLMPVKTSADVKTAETEPAPVEPVINVEEEVVEAPVQEPVVEEPVQEVVVEEAPAEEEVKTETLLADLEEFSDKSCSLLAKNNILTIEALKATLDEDPDIERLPFIGKTTGPIILKEFAAWETKQAQ